MKGTNFKEREPERYLMEGLSKLPTVRSGLGLSVIRWILLLQEPSYVTSLLSTGGLARVILPLICE